MDYYLIGYYFMGYSFMGYYFMGCLMGYYFMGLLIGYSSYSSPMGTYLSKMSQNFILAFPTSDRGYYITLSGNVYYFSILATIVTILWFFLHTRCSLERYSRYMSSIRNNLTGIPVQSFVPCLVCQMYETRIPFSSPSVEGFFNAVVEDTNTSNDFLLHVKVLFEPTIRCS